MICQSYSVCQVSQVSLSGTIFELSAIKHYLSMSFIFKFYLFLDGKTVMIAAKPIKTSSKLKTFALITIQSFIFHFSYLHM